MRPGFPKNATPAAWRSLCVNPDGTRRSRRLLSRLEPLPSSESTTAPPSGAITDQVSSTFCARRPAPPHSRTELGVVLSSTIIPPSLSGIHSASPTGMMVCPRRSAPAENANRRETTRSGNVASVR